MKFFRLLAAAAMAAAALLASARNTAGIHGTVRDADTRETVPFCAVRIDGNGHSSATLTDSIGPI